MSRQSDARRRRAVDRQHEMNVEFHTARAQQRRAYMPAPVDEFVRPADLFCSGRHTEDEPCEGES